MSRPADSAPQKTSRREWPHVLRQVDSPTLSNAIERLHVRPRCRGYAGYELRCAFPEQGPMVGYAVTCTADSATEDRRDHDGLMRLWTALDQAPRPSVLVIQDVGPERNRSCHMGEVMATTARALGAVGCATDGGVRDVVEVKALGDFQFFCPGFVVSHGRPVICDINVPVEIFGLRIDPGELLHGDVNGLLTVPAIDPEALFEQIRRVREEERRVLELVRQPGFSIEMLRHGGRTVSH